MNNGALKKMTVASVALYIYGDNLDPTYITQQLGIAPDLARRRGDRRQLPSGSVATQRTGVWKRLVKTDESCIASKISELIQEFKNVEDRIDTINGVDNINLDIYCAVSCNNNKESNEFNFVISKSDISIVASMGASLEITVSVTNDDDS